MKKIYLLPLLMIIMCFEIKAQLRSSPIDEYSLDEGTTIFLGNKSYPATDYYKIELRSSLTDPSKSFNSPYLGYMTEASIADILYLSIGKKSSNSGYLLLSFITEEEVKFQGDVYIYLDDNSVIKCTDRNIESRIDNRTLSLFYLTDSEISRLKSINIKEIEFGIKDYIKTRRITGVYRKNTISRIESLFEDY